MELKATHIDHLSYCKLEDRVWRIVDTTDGRNAVVGPIYTSMTALLEDFDAYYARAWAPNKKVQLFVVFGEVATDHWADELVTQDVKDELKMFEFDTQAEGVAFLLGLETMSGNQDFAVVTQADADRIQHEDAVDPDQDDDDDDDGEKGDVDDEGEEDGDGQQPAANLPAYPTSIEDHAERFADQIFVRVIGHDAFDTRWDIDCDLTDRWGQINESNGGSKPLHDLMVEAGLLERLREQMFDEITFIVRKDGKWGVLFELEINTIESEEEGTWEDHYPLKSRAEREGEVMQRIEALSKQFPTVEFACPHAFNVIDERSALWAFVADGTLSREQLDGLGKAILDFGYGPTPTGEEASQPTFLINREALLCVEIQAANEEEAAKKGDSLPTEAFHLVEDRTTVVKKMEG